MGFSSGIRGGVFSLLRLCHFMQDCDGVVVAFIIALLVLQEALSLFSVLFRHRQLSSLMLLSQEEALFTGPSENIKYSCRATCSSGV